jgi:hypothetical protein
MNYPLSKEAVPDLWSAARPGLYLLKLGCQPEQCCLLAIPGDELHPDWEAVT